MKWLVLSMSCISTFARLSVRAAANAAESTSDDYDARGTGTSGKPLSKIWQRAS